MPKLRRKKTATDTARSAKELACLVLGADGVSERHKKGVLHYVIWKMTEAEFAKYKLPLRTEAAHTQIEKRLLADLRHEHVYPRKWLVQQMLANPSEAAQLLESYAVACVVTKSEAKGLDRHETKRGWDRYRAESLTVVEVLADGSTRPFPFPE